MINRHSSWTPRSSVGSRIYVQHFKKLNIIQIFTDNKSNKTNHVFLLGHQTFIIYNTDFPYQKLESAILYNLNGKQQGDHISGKCNLTEPVVRSSPTWAVARTGASKGLAYKEDLHRLLPGLDVMGKLPGHVFRKHFQGSYMLFLKSKPTPQGSLKTRNIRQSLSGQNT